MSLLSTTYTLLFGFCMSLFTSWLFHLPFPLFFSPRLYPHDFISPDERRMVGRLLFIFLLRESLRLFGPPVSRFSNRFRSLLADPYDRILRLFPPSLCRSVSSLLSQNPVRCFFSPIPPELDTLACLPHSLLWLSPRTRISLDLLRILENLLPLFSFHRLFLGFFTSVFVRSFSLALLCRAESFLSFP